MQSFCAIVTSANLLLQAAFGCCQCWHGGAEHTAVTPQSASSQDCCEHCGDRQEPAERPAPSEGCVQCASMSAYLPTAKTTINGPTVIATLPSAKVPSLHALRDVSVRHELKFDEELASRPPLYLLHQVILI